MNAKQLVVEIAALPKLVESQKAAGLVEEEIIKSMYNSWQARLSAMKIPASNVEEITSALCAQTQPWLPDQRAALARTVMERQSVGGLKSIRRSMQSCPHYENMLTEEDWAELRTNKLMASSVACVSKRASLVGIDNASEPTLYRMVSILAYAHKKENMDQDEYDNLKEQIRMAIKARTSKAKSDIPYLVHYPISASDLPPEVINHAYRNKGPPPTVEIPELDTMLGINKMRPGRSPAWLKNVPEHYRHLFSTKAEQQPSSSGKKGSRCAASGITDPSSSLEASALPNVEHPPCQTIPMNSAILPATSGIFCPRMKRPAPSTPHWAHANQTVKIEIEDSPLKVTDATPANDADIDEMERRMLSAAKKRAGVAASKRASAAVLKKPAAARGADKVAKTVAKTTMKKRAGAAALKKPAAAVPKFAKIPDMTDVFDDLRKRGKYTSSPNVFKSNPYHIARVRMERAGASREQALDFARKMSGKAGELWDKLK